MPIKPSNEWEKATRESRPTLRPRVIPLTERTRVKSKTGNSGVARFLADLSVDTIIGAILLTLAPFGIWKLAEIILSYAK